MTESNSESAVQWQKQSHLKVKASCPFPLVGRELEKVP